MRPSDACLPIGPSSLSSQRTYRRVPAMLSLPMRLTDNRRARVLVDRLTRTAELTAGTNRPPRFLGNPKVPAPTSETPAGPPSQAGTGEQARPPLARTAGAPTTRPISGLNGPARTHAVYASPGGSPHQDARLASGCWPDSSGWALCPTGFLRKVSSMLLTSLSSFPRLLLAQTRVGPDHRSDLRHDVRCGGHISRRAQVNLCNLLRSETPKQFWGLPVAW
jgi:hypothetical protein